MSVRVRYAPSPTGLQHIGGVRTAIFNYFFARSQGGKFILRIEDTDQERYNEEAMEDLYKTLEWLNMDYDEGPDKDGGFGPYIQSERFDLYKEHGQKLLDDGKAYYCFCSSERLDSLREQQKKDKKDFGYDRHCRDLDSAEVQKKLDSGEPYVIRLKIPEKITVTFHDEILGDIKRKSKDISPDPVIIKTDGFPTYHLANVVDDHLMEITHIMRGQEWIPTTPLHVLMYEAFGWEPPKYCHLPMVMGKDGSKLSKRHGSTSVCDFRNKGYLSEAITNYISLVGWSYDDSREFFTKDELEELFDINKINKAPAVFDYRKLDWFNGQYIRKKNPEDLKELLLPILINDGVISSEPTDKELAIFDGALPIIHERLKLLNDISPMLNFLYKDINSWNSEDAIPKKMDETSTKSSLIEALALLKQFDGKNNEERENMVKERCEELELKLGQMMQPLRVAVTGSKISPPLFESIELLGLEKSIKRVEGLIAQL